MEVRGGNEEALLAVHRNGKMSFSDFPMGFIYLTSRAVRSLGRVSTHPEQRDEWTPLPKANIERRGRGCPRMGRSWKRVERTNANTAAKAHWGMPPSVLCLLAKIDCVAGFRCIRWMCLRDVSLHFTN